MSVAVALEELRRRVEEFGEHPFLVTVGADGHAHVVSVRVRMESDQLHASAGNTSRANLAANSNATLVWGAPTAGGQYALLVDGDGAVTDGEVVITPTRAVLHRLASAGDDIPGCIPIES